MRNGVQFILRILRDSNCSTVENDFCVDKKPSTFEMNEMIETIEVVFLPQKMSGKYETDSITAKELYTEGCVFPTLLVSEYHRAISCDFLYFLFFQNTAT